MSKPPRFTPAQRDAVLREYPTVCPAIHAYVLGLHEGFVQTRQRKLGVRKCKSYVRKGERRAI